MNTQSMTVPSVQDGETLAIYSYSPRLTIIDRTIPKCDGCLQGDEMPETMDHSTLSRLADAGAIQSTHVVGEGNGWSLFVKYGTKECFLAAQRSRKVRIFRKLETLVAYLGDLGITRFEVDASLFDQHAAKTERPDRSEALKRAHEAAAFDSWFRSQVQASLDDPSADIAHEAVEARFAAKREAARALLEHTRTSD